MSVNGITDRVDINQVLMQMREIRDQVKPGTENNTNVQGVGNIADQVKNTGQAEGAQEGGFADMLKEAVNSVNDAQQKSAELQEAFQMGDPEVDITQVMIQMQKASVSFEAMTQVRNRLVSAYQDIMNMPI
ncbi:hypothetical protein GCM10011403_01860 [Pseudohongiella nitratireducens]|uniref:Flagellar hook-basal body complex protein FliE n=1 Tax=Pseudohongiella nitratireducens TaxID=1768907 RepID=A0A917LPM8_9GAMM|nr:hypothetical protein GCM10011403_01860 [Pseudohongiella nitratireducens]|tara:strand:+ start:2033 stop:2425 length:393 start_codon:yes stop_codon:yes gene_type:complete